MSSPSPNIMTILMRMKQEVDIETIGLLIKFCQRALNSGNPRIFLRKALKGIVEAPEPEPTDEVRVVEVQVLGKK